MADQPKPVSPILGTSKMVRETDRVTRVAIHHHRYLKGYYSAEEPSVFVIHHDHEPKYVAASPDFPATLELPAGYKLDSGMKPLAADEKAKAVLLKKHYAEGASSNPQTVETKKGKGRASDDSPV